MPAGLGTSLFVGATTVGAVTGAFHHDWPAAGVIYWPAPDETYVVSRVLSVLCALWGFFGWLASSTTKNEPHPSIPNSQSAIVSPGRTPTPAATFFAWSLVTGVAVAVLTAYILIPAMESRLLNPDQIVERLPAAGMWNIIALLTAMLFWSVAVTRPQQPTLLLILAALLAWWTSLMIPSAVGSYLSRPSVMLPMQPVWWVWTFQMQFGFAVLLFIAAVLQESHYRMRRGRAWPDRLDELLKPYSQWPAYTQIESVIAAAILVLGVFHIVRPGPPSWQLAIANGAVSSVASATCLFMTYRRWSTNTAGLGIALSALAAVALACAVVPIFTTSDDSAEYATRLPVVYNAVLLAMAVMIALWSWLSRFWEQQLLGGAAWTTTGRMIPYAQRAAYLLTALAVLAAFQMALWPKRVLSSVEDNSPGRLVAGILVLLLLAVITARNARRTNSRAAATLGIAFLVAAVFFVFIRLPTEDYHSMSALRGWISQHVAVIFSAIALPLLIIAERLPKTRWRCFSLPLWCLALLVLPATALAELLVSQRLPADWVQPAVLAVLGVLGLVAGRRRHRRAILVPGGVLLVLAAWSWYRAHL